MLYAALFYQSCKRFAAAIVLKPYRNTCFTTGASKICGKFWERTTAKRIEFESTIVKAGAHWPVFKRCFILQFNLFWINFFLHMSFTRLLTKILRDFEALRPGLRRPLWWKRSVRSWKEQAFDSARRLGNQYQTDHLNFISTCSV